MTGILTAFAGATYSGKPGAPTSVSAASTGCSSVSVSFSAACNGGLTIDTYQVFCASTGLNTASGSSSPISVIGLTACTSYTFKVRAHNSLGYGANSTPSSSATTSNTRYYFGSTGRIVPCSGGQFTPQLASAIAVDKFKNNYIVGTSPGGCQAIVFKANTSGSIVWSKKLCSFPNSGGSSAFGHTGAVTTDATGNVYVGWRKTSYNASEYGIYKVNSSNGTVVAGFGDVGAAGGSTMTDIAVSGCTVFMYGTYYQRSSSINGYLIKSCLCGNNFYTTTTGRNACGICQNYGCQSGISISADGANAYVGVNYSVSTGYSGGTLAFIASVPTTGASTNPQNSTYWSGLYRVGAPTNCTPISGYPCNGYPYYYLKRLKIDSSNNVYVNGCVTGAGPYVPGCIYGGRYYPYIPTVMKLNSAGTGQWISGLYSNGSRHYASMSTNDMLVDSNGNSYLHSVVSYNDTSGYMWEIIIAKFNSSGVLQWQRFVTQTNGDYTSSKFNIQQYPSVKMAFADTAQTEIRLVIPVETSRPGIYIAIPTDGSKTFQSQYMYAGYYVNVSTASLMDGYYPIAVSYNVNRQQDGGMRVNWSGPYSFGTRAATLTCIASPQTAGLNAAGANSGFARW